MVLVEVMDDAVRGVEGRSVGVILCAAPRRHQVVRGGVERERLAAVLAARRTRPGDTAVVETGLGPWRAAAELRRRQQQQRERQQQQQREHGARAVTRRAAAGRARDHASISHAVV
eukprot:SAG31_NODE_329_length_17643_cov_10.377793_10_plen_116_part_00